MKRVTRPKDELYSEVDMLRAAVEHSDKDITILRIQLDAARDVAAALADEAMTLRPYKRGSFVLMAGLFVLLIVAIAGWAR